jgi:hypothetical protein
MKRGCFIGGFIFICLSGAWMVNGSARARGQLYDNFDSGLIDPDRRDVDDSSA